MGIKFALFSLRFKYIRDSEAKVMDMKKQNENITGNRHNRRLNGYVFGIILVVANLFMVFPIMAQNDIKTIVIDPGHGGSDGGARGKYTRESVVALQISLKLREELAKEMPELKVLLTRDKDVLPGGLSDVNGALRWRANFANENNADLFISIHLNATPGNQRYENVKTGTKEQTYYAYSGKGKSRKKVKKTRTVAVYEKHRLPPSVFGTQTYVLASDYYKGKVAAASKASAKMEDYEQGDEEGVEMPEMDPVEARIRAKQYAKYFFQKSLTLATYCEEEFAKIGRRSMGVWQRDWAAAAGIHVLTATQMPSILIESGFVDHWEEEDYLKSDEGSEAMAKSIVEAIKRYRNGLINPENLTTQKTQANVTE